MKIRVMLPQVLRASADGASKIELEVAENATLGVVLDEIAVSHPALERRLRDESRALRQYVNFYLDGEECRRLDGSGTRLVDGAEVRVIPSVAGG